MKFKIHARRNTLLLKQDMSMFAVTWIVVMVDGYSSSGECQEGQSTLLGAGVTMRKALRPRRGVLVWAEENPLPHKQIKYGAEI